MTTFRTMRPDEFAAYRDYFIADYANEIAANFGYSLQKSKEIAQKELADDLPQQVATPGNSLLCIEDNSGRKIGYLWYKLFDAGETAFILDIVLFEHLRGMGHGKAAFVALEERLTQSGVEQIKLRVAFDNKRAFGLYEKLGFSVTGYNMVKLLNMK